MKFLITLGLSVCLLACSSMNRNSWKTEKHYIVEDKMPREPGKCYAKCLIPDQSIEELVRYPKYTDTDTFGNSNLHKIQISEKSSQWVKKKAENCRSSNPDDCLIWCLEEIPARFAPGFGVKDTSLTKKYIWQEINVNSLTTKGGYTEWREVVCESDLTDDLLGSIENALNLHGYDPGSDLSFSSLKFKSALTQFQKDNSIPVGQLTIETINLLGVRL